MPLTVGQSLNPPPSALLIKKPMISSDSFPQTSFNLSGFHNPVIITK